MSEISILKDGSEVASATRVDRALLDGQIWSGISELHCYYFETLSLSPPVTFRHLAGEALVGFLDNTSLVIDDEVIEPARYVHGRSEVMKGKHEVSAVLLAKIVGSVTPAEWMSYLPSIYRRFLAHDRSSKTS